MEHSKKYYMVKKYYDDGLWSEYRVRMAVEKGWITSEEYESIINHESDPETATE
ncbi:MAG: XkdX family protein [Lachnospiraceae bacterium]